MGVNSASLAREVDNISGASQPFLDPFVPLVPSGAFFKDIVVRHTVNRHHGFQADSEEPFEPAGGQQQGHQCSQSHLAPEFVAIDHCHAAVFLMGESHVDSHDSFFLQNSAYEDK